MLAIAEHREINQTKMILGRSSFLICLFLSVALLGAWTSVWSQAQSLKFVYVSELGRQGLRSDRVAAFMIDAATGALTPVPSSPFSAGAAPDAVTIDPRLCGELRSCV